MTEFDKLFHDNLKDGESEAPPFVWENIENEIEQDKRKKGLFFFFWPLGILAILLSSVAIYYWMGDSSQQASLQTSASEQNLSAQQNEQTLQPIASDQFYSTIETKEDQAKLHQEKSKTEAIDGTESSSRDNNSNQVIDASTPSNNSEDKDAASSINIASNVVNKDNQQKVILKTSATSDNNGNNFPVVAQNKKEQSKTKKEKEMKGINANPNLPNTLLKQAKVKAEKPLADDNISTVDKNETTSVTKKENNGVARIPVENKNETRSVSPKEDLMGDSLLLDKTDTVVLLAALELVPEDRVFIEDKDMLLLLVQNVNLEQGQEQPKSKRFFVETRVGYSNYKMSLWKPSFAFGDLSNRKFRSSGVNVNLTLGYQIKSWLNPIIGFNYNNKQAEFNYSALYDDDGFLSHDVNGNRISLDEINDIDSLCNQYVLTDIKAVFDVGTVSVTLGNRFNLLQLKKIGIDLDLSYSLELTSTINVSSVSKIDVSKNLTESFNSKIAAGLNINYQLSEQFKLFIHTEYIFKPYNSNNFHRSDVHEFIHSIGLRFSF